MSHLCFRKWAVTWALISKLSGKIIRKNTQFKNRILRNKRACALFVLVVFKHVVNLKNKKKKHSVFLMASFPTSSNPNGSAAAQNQQQRQNINQTQLPTAAGHCKNLI